MRASPMPIYEYLCPTCNRVFSFMTHTVHETRLPACLKCGSADMRKQVSRFAFVRGGAPARGGAGPEPGAGDGPDPLDDPRVEREMMRLMSQAEHMDEDDPRQLGHLMRRMSEITGEPLDGEMEEAVRRLEAGEDPEKVEADLGDVFGDGEPGDGGFGGPPSYDDGLYSF
ncbi:MAG: zinc ribbon domain-containing protein [Chloroflexi bacterium CFX6]|nr:zinc ribbon domain-containing protein [Chloroflexi bacterium CFX6]